MEQRGLVVREECAEDARGAMVRMPAAGQSAIKAAAPGHVAATRRYVFDLLSEKEMDVLIAVFDRVLANLGCVGDETGDDALSPPSRKRRPPSP